MNSAYPPYITKPKALRSCILCSVVASCLCLATAGWGASWLEGEFRKLDADGDGRLNAEEAAARGELKGADADGDGLLTLEEVTARTRQVVGQRVREMATPELLAAHLKNFDEDQNGTLSIAELQTAKLPWLAVFDGNADGEVSTEELGKIFAEGKGRPRRQEEFAPLDQPPPLYEGLSASKTARAPRQLKASEQGVGRRVADFEVQASDGALKPWPSLAGERGTVIALVSPTCPVGARLLPELARQSAKAAAQGVKFLFVDLDADLGEASGAEAMKHASLAGEIIRDPSEKLRATLRAQTTTEVFVIDAARTLVYRGAVDDRYGVGWSRDNARATYLKDALAALPEGKPITAAATEAPGCELEKPAAEAGALPLTYHSRISRILQNNCVECHRSGGLAPFALETLAQVSAKAGMIRRVVDDGLMPPWFADPAPAGQHTPWINERSLAAEDKADLLAWLASDRPEGDPAEAPLARVWPSDWEIGQPDVVYQIPEPIAVQAEGVMPYQNIVVDTGLTEEKWVRAWQVEPTDRSVVHHVLIWARDPSLPKNVRQNGDDGAGFFAAYVPGSNKIIYPETLGKKLPKGAQLRFQIHYTPNGKATQDQIRLAVRFSEKPPQHEVEVATIAQPRLRIPPGVANHPEAASVPIPAEVKLLGMSPHMHFRGQSFRYELVLPDGAARTVLNVPRYDFNWQLGYYFAEPLTLPAGSRLRAIGWFDNSANNPANPDPAKTVTWGEQSFEEMMIGYAEYYVPSRPLPHVSAAR